MARLFKVKDVLPRTEGKLRITDASNDSIIYENDDAFDISGRREIVEVNTPDKSLSQQPYEEGIIPFRES